LSFKQQEVDVKRAGLFALVILVSGGAALAQGTVDEDGDGVFRGSGAATQVPESGSTEGGSGATLLGAGWSLCPVGTIDTTTGSWTSLGNAGFDKCNSLARDSAGVFYSAADPGVGVALITIDSSTGAGTQVALLSTELSVRALAFSPSDVLYAVHVGAEGNELWIIDTTTGNTTLVGEMGFGSVQCMAFHPTNGTLYAADNTEGLLTVDPATGVATDVNGGVGGTGDVQTITVVPDGTIFGVRNDLYSIDPVTGVYTLLATGGYPDLRGADFIGPIPVELMGFTVE